MEKKYFMLYLNPPRTTFFQDMTDDERGIMQKHIVYWTDLMSKGVIKVFGPVMDPKGVYGAGVVAVNNEEELKELMANDPANGLNQYEWYPMKAVVPSE